MTASADTNGIVIGIVSDLDDPESLARVKVKLPHLDDQETDWARLAAPMAGNGRGTFFRPEVGDEVLIAMEHGDPRRAYVIGALWSQKDSPPPDDGDKKKNNWRFVKSRSGHVIKLDDTDGAERIEIVDKDGSRKVVIDSSGSKIQIVCDQGDVEISAPTGEVKVDASSIKLQAQGEISIEAGATLTLSGATVSIN